MMTCDLQSKYTSVIWLLILCGFTACKSQHPERPKHVDQACALLQHDPTWAQSLKNARQKWGAPVELILAIIRHESSFRAQARPPQRYWLGVIPKGRISTAYGYAQVIDRTWRWFKKSTGQPNHRRDHFAHAVDFIAWYIHISHQKLGIGFRHYRHQYYAYHEGHSGFKKKSYRSKPSLIEYTKKVTKTARQYKRQLRHCSLDK